MLRLARAVTVATPVVTHLRDSQLMKDSAMQRMLCQDVPVDIICTPTQTIVVHNSLPMSTRAYWDKLKPRTDERQAMRDFAAAWEEELNERSA